MLDISEVENIGVGAPVKAFIAVPSVSPLELITCERTDEAADVWELKLPVYAVREVVEPDAGPYLESYSAVNRSTSCCSFFGSCSSESGIAVLSELA